MKSTLKKSIWLVQGVLGVSLTTVPSHVLASSGGASPGASMQSTTSGGGLTAPPSAPEGSPNIVVILLDDVGFGATNSFGGPVRTPMLDKLAAEGLRYNQFHTTAVSSPTRASLLTGRNHHQVGFGFLAELPQDGAGYTTVWPKNSVSIPEILRRNGYSTVGFGKWHNTPIYEVSPAGPFDRWPTGLGFEYYYGFHGAQTSQWEPLLFRNTIYAEPPATPKQGYHLAIDTTDDAIRWLHTHEAAAPQKPYFLYFAPAGAHAPHHVPDEWIAKYKGRFDQGWDKLREEIFARQKAMGVIPANADLTPRPKEFPAWDSLNTDQKRLMARQMEVFSANVEFTDHEVGRLLDAVRTGPNGNNTLVLYVVGDNGGSSEGGMDGSDCESATVSRIPNPVPDQLPHIDELGSEKWDNHFAVPWAWATNTPFQWIKMVASHFGGTRNGLVVSWPGKLKAHGEIRGQFSHVNDIAPTIYEATGIAMPPIVDGVKQIPLEGRSLVPTFANAHASTGHHVQYFEVNGNRAIYKDGWLAAAPHYLGGWAPPRADLDNFDGDKWELYHVDVDFSAAHDLSYRNPGKLAELKSMFDREAKRNQVFPLHNSMSSRSILKHRVQSYGDSKTFIYHADQAPLPMWSVPSLLRAHRFTALLDIPTGGAEGVIVANGGRYGGFSLYVKNGYLLYENNFVNKTRDLVTSSEPIPHGIVEVAVSYEPDGRELWGGGIMRLEINGKQVAEGRLDNVGIPEMSESLDVGKDGRSPVSNSYEAPFAFTGKIGQVRLTLQ